MARARTKSEQSQKTITLIMEAATRLFVAHGYHGTSISTIAKAAGLTKGALYAHFASKEALLLSLMLKFEKEYLDQLVKEMIRRTGTARDKLHRFVSFSADFADKNRNLCLLATIISAEFSGAGNEELESELRRIYSKYARHLRRVVEYGKREGVFDLGLDTHHLAYLIIAMHDGLLLSWQRSNEFLDGPDFVSTYRRLLFSGISPGGGNRPQG
jgi:AcrR family transcriptional regulator